MPDPAVFPYTFDMLSEVTEAFLQDRGLEHHGLFVQDYGSQVGFRIVTRNPEALDWLIIENTNAYEIGFTKACDGFPGSTLRIGPLKTKRLSQRFWSMMQ
jgi:hypothetical protein